MDRRTKVKYGLYALAALLIVVCVFTVIHIIDNRPDGKGGGRDDAAPDPTYLYFGDKEYEVTHNIKTYLLLGTDGVGKRPGSKKYHGPMADYFLCLVIDKTAETYGFVQIDRDTMTDVNMIGPDGDADTCMSDEMQICVTTWYGADLMQGLENAVASTEYLLGGLDIDGYYSINMKDIATLNNAVGGVTVTLDEDLSDLDPELKKGATVHLNDRQANYFVQHRMDVGDGTNESRMKRQKAYMQSLMDQSKEKMASDKSYALDLFDDLEDIAMTNLNKNRISAIANLLYKYENKGIFDIEGEHTMGRVQGDKKNYVQFWYDEDSVMEIMRDLAGLDEGHTY